MKRNRFIATIAAGLGIIALVPVATAVGDGDDAPSGQTIEAATALGTAFTYQGRLTDAGSPANGNYDLRFILYDAESAGAAVGSTVTKEDVAVTNGLFSTELDFGASPWNGDARWVEISVRAGSSTGTFTVLSPRQPVSPTPYALFAKAAAGVAVPFSATGTLASSGITGLFSVTQNGTGIGIVGNRTSTDVSEFPGVLGVNAGGGAGVQGESLFTGAGVGVRGIGNGTGAVGGEFIGDVGIEIDGAIKVSGSTPAAFVHSPDTAGSGQTTCPSDDSITIIDNPLTNENPDALLFVMPVDPTSNGLQGFLTGLGVIYDSDICPGAADKWAIYTTATGPVLFTEDLDFNVLVISQ